MGPVVAGMDKITELQKCFQPALLLTRSLPIVQYVYELIACVRRANENDGNLISVVQFLIRSNILEYNFVGYQ